MQLLDENHRFVPFVGAGASAQPPSRLPTWTEFNDLVLESLCERVGRYSDARQPTDEMLRAFRARRDGTRFLSPDFQAQLMEEEVGAEYFRVWQSLDSDVYGPVHEGLAELASRGRLAAIVTTNFDRLIESALEERGQPFRAFYDEGTFKGLSTGMTHRDGPLPIIKIHGSIEDTASLVDTLKQRLAGRPSALIDVIGVLLREYPWLYLGYSGADFSHAPHYLGILDAAPEAKGFVFVARKGVQLLDGVGRLADAYGPSKAEVVEGDLSSWLSETFALAAATKVESQPSEENASISVSERIDAWTESLTPLGSVNILCSLLEGSGLEQQAFWLLRKTWKSYRRPEDTKGKSYDRYNYNYGLALLDAGLITNPVVLAYNRSTYDDPDLNAYEFLGRSYMSSKRPAAGAHLAAVCAYRGEVGKAISLAREVTDDALAGPDRLAVCDVALASVAIYDIVRLAEPAADQLRFCVELAEELGDEPRRAMLCAQLGRFLTYSGRFDEARDLIDRAEAIGSSLDLEPVLLAARAARGRWLVDSETSDQEAIQVLQEALSAYRGLHAEPLLIKLDLLDAEAPPARILGRHPALCRVLLDLNRAARFAGNAEIMEQSLKELDTLVNDDVYDGYYPHFCFAHAECLLHHPAGDQRAAVAELIRSAREVGNASGNPWAVQQAEQLWTVIDSAQE